MPYESHLQLRYDDYMRMLDWNKLAAHLELAYDQTHNENVLVAMRIITTMQQDMRDSEIRLNEADVQEIRNHPDLYPHAVVSWAFGYYDKEVS